MLPQSDFDSPMLAPAQAPVAIAALTQDRALIGLLRSTLDPSHDLILVSSEAELTPHLNGRRVSACLLDSMFIEGDLAAMAERLRERWPDLVLVVVGTAEEQSKVASQITSGVVYRFLHRPVSAPRVRLFVEAALRRHEVENVERTLEQARPDFSRFEAARSDGPRRGRGVMLGIVAAVAVMAGAGLWFALRTGGTTPGKQHPVAAVDSQPKEASGAADAVPEPVVPQPQEPAPAPVAAPDTGSRPAPASAAAPSAPTPQPVSAPRPPADTESVAERLRPSVSQEPVPAPAPSTAPVRVPDESTPQSAPPPPVLTFDQRLRNQLDQAEAALQRGELASPAGRNAVELFSGALEMDPSNTLAKAGLVRVADRLLSAAERALTAGNAEDAKKMVDIAERLTPATARGAFLMMQIEMEHERATLTRQRDTDLQNKLEKGATYLRLAGARLKSGALIEPSEDNARFYLEAARQILDEDPALADLTRALQKELLARAMSAASVGNAAETERWLANADGAGASRPDVANIRRALQDKLNGARAARVSALTVSFSGALTANRLLDPPDDSAKAHLLALMATDESNPVVATARQSLGAAYLREMRSALGRNDVDAASVWAEEAHTIRFSSDELVAAESDLKSTRERIAQQSSVVGANSLQRIEYVAPKFPPSTRNGGVSGWVELEFTVRMDGSTADIVVTNSSPRRTFDAAARTAISQWRYKPVVRDGKAVEQRAAVRIRFSDE